MPDIPILDVLLHGDAIGTLHLLPGERSLFAFDQAYIDDRWRDLLSLSFKDSRGGLIDSVAPARGRLPPFFANLLPPGSKRGVDARRAFILLAALGRDLPGAVTIRPAQGEAWPPIAAPPAGNELSFPAHKNTDGGFTLAAEGVGGSWVVKLPSSQLDGLCENEFALMVLAARVGIDVTPFDLVARADIAGVPDGLAAPTGRALLLKRGDRSFGQAVHMETFAQVFGIWPDDERDHKNPKASCCDIAGVLAVETGNAGVAEFIRRLVFNTLIGNAEMPLENWSLIYPDRRTAALAPAGGFVSTVAHRPATHAALTYGRTRRMDGLTADELAYIAGKAGLSERLVLDTARETVERFCAAWQRDRQDLPLTHHATASLEAHLKTLPIARI